MKHFTYKFISLFVLLFTMSFSICGQEETHTQTLSFPEGWSLFSINTYPSSGLTIGSLFNEVSDDIIIIRNSIGNAYLPAFEFDGIGDVNLAEAYAIKTLNPFTLNITGQIVSPADIIFDNNLNRHYISYPRIDSIPAQCISNIFWLRDYKGNIFIPGAIDQIGDLIPGHGYETGPISQFSYNSYQDQCPQPTMDFTNSTPINLDVMPGMPGTGFTYVLSDASWLNLPPENSDIGIYNLEGKLLGASRYTSPYTAITCFGQDDLATSEVEGCVNGDVLSLRIFTENDQIIEVSSGGVFSNSMGGDYLFSWNYSTSPFLSWSQNDIGIYGCTNELGLNYNPEATIDDGSCEYEQEISGCTDELSLNYNPEATIDDGSCEYEQEISGCTDELGLNYNPEATIDDGSCEYEQEISGCTDELSLNYNPEATIDDGSCEYEQEISGCTDELGLNYNPEVTIDDGSCEYEQEISGCTDELGLNYNSLATTDDGSCEYNLGNEYCTPSGQSNSSHSINRFVLGDIDSGHSPLTSVSSSTYSNRTEIVADLISNQTYSSFVQLNSVNTSTKIIEIYVDFNMDFDFMDDNELLISYQTGNQGGSANYNFAVNMPNFTEINAPAGETRLRIVTYVQNEYFSPNSSCIESNNYQGETEDYTVNLIHSGCTNPLATNFNELATHDDETCDFEEGTCP